MSEQSKIESIVGALPKRTEPIGKRLRILLIVVFALFGLLSVNAIYLVAVRVLEWQTGRVYQNLFYLQMFLIHLIVGVIGIVPTVLFVAIHLRNTLSHRNRRAVRAGLALLTAVLVLIVSGVVLMRVEGIIEVNNPKVRSVAFWAHLLSPLFIVWLYVLHRLAGKKIQWAMGLRWVGVAGVLAGLLLFFQVRDPRAWNVVGTNESAELFFPARSRSSTGIHIDSKILRNDKYCVECHQDVHSGWANSAHRFSSFNNPAYVTSVRETRADMIQRDGNVKGARFCAGCHDPVPLFSGEFDTEKYDDPKYDIAADFEGGAGITCTVCHAISHVNSRLGNGDYTIDEPIHYPFAFSDNESLKWVNRQLIKAKPRFHKQTFLKPLHETTEFCGACHKVHLPKELNDYRWLRGQNHFDSFWLSGVSGHSVSSFYYPKVAEENCNNCHMPLIEVAHSRDYQNFSARVRAPGSGLTTKHHLFPGANTGIPHILRDQMPDADSAIADHAALLKDCMRVDIFGIREEGRIDGALTTIAPGSVPKLVPGKTYLLEVVLRTLTLGHHFTQGTSDSNQVWVDVSLSNGTESIGSSGALETKHGTVDPWAYFLNSFVIDRNGDRINRRNAEDIFVALYNHQIPPGAADVVHYRFTVPEDAQNSVRVAIKLNYRKFDTEYMRIVLEQGDDYVNDLPIVQMAEGYVEFPIGDSDTASEFATTVPEWQRWNDFGIGLLRQGQYRQAEEAFKKVESLGHAAGPLNLARVYLAEGRVQDEAPDALRRAREMAEVGEQPGAPPWTLLWFSGLVNKQNAEIDAAMSCFDQIIEGGFAESSGRNFDFSQDYRLLIEAADTAYIRGLRERGESRAGSRNEWMQKAVQLYEDALNLDPENAAAHYGIRRVYEELDESAKASHHDALHVKYKTDDNARDTAIAAARRKYPAANRAAESVVVYDLQRDRDHQQDSIE